MAGEEGSGGGGAGEEARDGLAPEWQRAFAYIEQAVGGRIVRHERHARWRPAFDVDVECDGEVLPVHFRGDRGAESRGVYGIDHEFRSLKVLEAEGVQVPHVYGFCEDPLGIVMSRAPGRPNLATAENEAERAAVLDDYVRALVQMHAIEPGKFEAAGFARPASAGELAWDDFPHWKRVYDKTKPAPDPSIAFVIAWLGRNLPVGRDEVTFCHGDAGQFIFDRGHMTAVLDLELSHLGDPANDVGALFCRDLSEPLGNLEPAVRRYVELSGREMDPHVVHFHAIRFAICTPMSTVTMLHRPSAQLEPVQYIGWYHVYARMPLELIAHEGGVELEEPQLPEPEPTRQASGFDALGEMLGQLQGRDEFEAYRVATAARLASYLQRVERYGPALESDDLDEAAVLLGHRPASWRDADAALEAFVEGAPAERDPEIVRYLHRRHLRQIAILDPVLREMRGVAVQKLPL